MKFSLYVIQNRLSRKGIYMRISCSHKFFFKNVQILPSCLDKIDTDYLYIVTEQISCPEQIPENCSLLFCSPCTCHIASDYLMPTENYSYETIFNSVIQIMEILNHFEFQMSALLIQKKSLQDCVELTANIMENPAYAIDTSFRVLAIDRSSELPFISITWKRLLEHGYMPLNTIMSLLKNDDWNQYSNLDSSAMMTIPEFYLPFINCNLKYKNQLQGHFFVVGIYHPLHQGDLDIMDQIIPYMNQLITTDIVSPSFRGNYYEHFFKDVISGRLRDQELIKEQLTPLNWKPEGLYCILSSCLDTGNERLNQTIFNRLTHVENGKPVISNDMLYCVFFLKSQNMWTSLIKQLEQLFQQCRHKAGISELFRGFRNLNQYVKQAENALDLGTRLNDKKFFYLYEHYRLKHIFKILKDSTDSHTIIHKAVLDLEQYDKQNRTQYALTLFEYLRNERKLVETAKKLNIHRNSLLYRLEKIENIIAVDLDDPDIRMQILLSFGIQNNNL